MIRFLYEQELIELDQVPADLTVLDWLRLHRRRTGTKEGCGSGDCGACTVVVVSVEELPTLRLSHEAINSCITFVGALHGKQLLTVESLSIDGRLHPVQQALVDEHGSQCGFCTPGFVMSLYALYQQRGTNEELQQHVDQALGGNLCRCTGYRPIKAAAEKAICSRGIHSNAAIQDAEPLQAVRAKKSEALNNSEQSQHSMAQDLLALNQQVGSCSGFYQPDSIEEFSSRYLDSDNLRILGGGTDLALEVTQQMKNLPHIIHTDRVPELKVIEEHDNYLLLGSAVTLSQCLVLMGRRIPAARQMLLRFGSDQVRNQATIGGNLGSASPIGDLPPLLMALDAQLYLQRGDALRTVTIQDYFLGYRKTCLQAGEFIRHIKIPVPAENSLFAMHKVSKRYEDDISTVCLAMHLPRDNETTVNARLAFGGMAAIPVRAKKAEQALNNVVFNEAAVHAAQEQLSHELTPISDARASADYRMQVAQNLLLRVLMETQT